MRGLNKWYLELDKLIIKTKISIFTFLRWFQLWNYWKSFEMNKKGWKTAEKNVSTSFWVCVAPKSWSKYTTTGICISSVFSSQSVRKSHAMWASDWLFTFKSLTKESVLFQQVCSLSIYYKMPQVKFLLSIAALLMAIGYASIWTLVVCLFPL